MTEQEWMACDDPQAMLKEMVRPRSPGDPPDPLHGYSPRKLRLFACACYVGVFDPGGDLWKIAAVIVRAVEKWADGEISREEALADQPPDNSTPRTRESWYLFGEDPAGAASNVLGLHSRYSRFQRAALLREVVGNPFRPVKIGCSRGHKDCAIHRPDWLTPTVLSVARAIYETDTFDECPILADALEEAGCTDEALLSHLRGEKERVHGGTRLDNVLISNPEAYYLRSPGVHVRGCWAVDLILGKS